MLRSLLACRHTKLMGELANGYFGEWILLFANVVANMKRAEITCINEY